MTTKFNILNFESLRKASCHAEPFPYIIVDNIIQPSILADVVATFPKVNKRGSFPLESVSYSGSFAELMKELQQPELRNLIADHFKMDLKDKPPMITVRGYTGEKDGAIHVDSSSKLVTFLLYLNPNWGDPKGRLRLLKNNHDLNDFVAEISPEAGRCLIFKVTDNCWHGHEPFVGERRSIQLNYVVSDKAKNRHMIVHRFSAFIKKLVQRIMGKQDY